MASAPKNQFEDDKRIADIAEERQRLYERFVLGELDGVAYKAESTALDVQAAQLVGPNSALSAERVQFSKARAQHKELMELAGSIVSEKTLTHRLVDLLVKKVLAFPGGRVEVKWNEEAFLRNCQIVSTV